MEETLKIIFDYLIANYALYLVVTMSIIISLTIAILTLVKKPIKQLTGKIQNEKLRKLVNKMFIFFAFGICALFWLILSWISTQYFEFEAIRVLLTGAFSIVIYSLGDGVIGSDKAKELIETVKEINEDKTLNKNDDKAMKDLVDSLKKVK